MSAAVRHADGATQTAGSCPDTTRTQLRDILAPRKVLRVTVPGSAGMVEAELPQEGCLPLPRSIR